MHREPERHPRSGLWLILSGVLLFSTVLAWTQDDSGSSQVERYAAVVVSTGGPTASGSTPSRYEFAFSRGESMSAEMARKP